VTIPSLDRIGTGLFERLNGHIILSRQRASLDGALDRLSHVQPGACIRRREEEDAGLCTPLQDAGTLLSCSIVPDMVCFEQPDSVQVVHDLSTVEELELGLAMSRYILQFLDAPDFCAHGNIDSVGEWYFGYNMARFAEK
jgi:hypothetical protein